MGATTIQPIEPLGYLTHLEGTLRMSFLGVGVPRASDWVEPVFVIEVAHDMVDPVRLHAWLEVDVRGELADAGHGTAAIATDDLNCQLWVTGARTAEKVSLVLAAGSQVRDVRWSGSLTAQEVQDELGLLPVAGLSARDTLFTGAVYVNTGFMTEWLATMPEHCCMPWSEDHLRSSCEGIRSGDYWSCVSAGVRDRWYGPAVPSVSLPELEEILARQ